MLYFGHYYIHFQKTTIYVIKFPYFEHFFNFFPVKYFLLGCFWFLMDYLHVGVCSFPSSFFISKSSFRQGVQGIKSQSRNLQLLNFEMRRQRQKRVVDCQKKSFWQKFRSASRPCGLLSKLLFSSLSKGRWGCCHAAAGLSAHAILSKATPRHGCTSR